MRWIKKGHFSNLLKLFVFAFGGLLGALLNWSITFSLTEYFLLYYVLSSIIGNVINSLFNFTYHRSVTFKVGTDARSRFVKFVVINVLIVALNVSIMFIFTEVFHIWYLASSIMATFVIVILNFVLNQSIVFFEPAEVDYRSIKGEFPETGDRSRNLLRAWLHKNRQQTLRSMVSGYYFPEAVAIELGYGSCSGMWNDQMAPVIGVDVNRAVLARGLSQKRLSGCIEGDPGSLSFKAGSADILLAPDLLAHTRDYQAVLAEANRVLKPGGRLLITVPYDTPFSLWKPLFFLQCLLQWYVFGDDYYRNRCGIVTSFSPASLRDALHSNGFSVAEEITPWRMSIYMDAVKMSDARSYEDVTVIIPTLNESDNIGKLLDCIERLYPGISVVVADDGSKDGTRDIVLGKHGTNGKITLLDRSAKPHGLTASVVDAICSVATSRFVVIDADFQHPPEKIGEIISLLEDADLVVGTRIKVENWGLSRQFMSIVATTLGKISLFVHRSASCNDIMSGFFGARTALARHYIEASPSAFAGSGYKVLFDLLKLLPRKTRVCQVPYTFANRSEGTSKISTRHIVVYFTSLFR